MVDSVDLNADLGESFGSWKMGNDADMLGIVSSANIACGFHAGDPQVMADTLVLAQKNGVDTGAHPGFADLRGFGRFPIHNQPMPQIYHDIIYQIGALQALATIHKANITHVKLHGAINNMACENAALADIFVKAVTDLDASLIIVAVANTELEHASVRGQARFVREVFADRAYQDNGLLVPRNQAGAVIHDPEEAAERVLRMANDGEIIAAGGKRINVTADTVCVHGDNPVAVKMAEQIRKRLESAGIKIQGFSRNKP